MSIFVDMDNTYLDGRITVTKQIIEAYEAAILALGEKGVQNYKLDTGQNVQWVTYADLPRMNRMLDSLYNRLSTMCARRYGTGVSIGQPAF